VLQQTQTQGNKKLSPSRKGKNGGDRDERVLYIYKKNRKVEVKNQ